MVSVTAVNPNHAPAFNAVASQSATVGQALTVALKATDPDSGQTLTYSLDPGSPAGAVINAVTGLLTFTPESAGSYSITVRATDNGSPALSATQTVFVQVVPVPIQIGGVTVTLSKNQVSTINVNLGTQANAASAQTLSSYTLVQLVTTGKGKKAKTVEKSLALKSAAYNPSTGQVQLTPAKKFSLTGSYQLRINGSTILDNYGQGLDGNRDGVPGGQAKYSLSKRGGSILPSAVGIHLSPTAVDHYFMSESVISGKIHGR